MKKLKNIHFKLKYYNFRLIFFIISLTLLGIIVIGSAAPGQNYQMKQLIGMILGAMMMRFKGYPFYLIHDGHVKVSRPFNVGGYRAHYKFKELAYNERMVYFRKFIKWNRGCE